MVTIKDIAREAGVSQGTVSNVLNGKGNVSSQKIHLVQETAQKLGYTLNQRAQVLRKGFSRTLAVVIPDVYNRQYVDFYVSFKNYAQEQGYQVNLYLTGDSKLTEEQAILQISTNITAGAAVFTTMADGEDHYRKAGLQKVVYVERNPGFACTTVRFDMREVGRSLAEMARQIGYKSIAVLTENASFSSQKEFLEAFKETLRDTATTCAVYHTDVVRCPHDAFQLLGASPLPEAVFVTNYAFAGCVNDLCKHFCQRRNISVYALSPLLTMPGGDMIQYEMNYRLMGKRTAQVLLENLNEAGRPEETVCLKGNGVRNWTPPAGPKCDKLTVVTLDSPSARILRDVAQLYTQATGTEINVAFYSYDGLNEMLGNIENTNSFDVIRIDGRRLSWYAEKTLTPLREIDPDIERLFEGFLPGLKNDYSQVNGELYALPTTPSSQLLFYRKDLFESAAWRRQYAERFGRELKIPATFEEFNQIAAFFSRKLNPASPTLFGTTFTMGNSNVAGKEFLTRYFSHTPQLYAEGKLRLTSQEGVLSMGELLAVKPCTDEAPCPSWQHAAHAFARGQVAMTIMFSNFAPTIVQSNSCVLDKIGYALVPGGNPMTGGSAIGVCKTSRRKEEALRFIRWLCTEEVATAMTLMGTMSPCKKTYENYEVMDLYPWLVTAKDHFALSRTAYAPPNDPRPFDEPKFLGILGMAVNTAFGGIMSVEEALAFAETTFNRSFYK